MPCKKWLAVLVVLGILLGALTACGRQKSVASSDPAPDTGDPAPVSMPAEVPRPDAPDIPAVQDPRSANEKRPLVIQENGFDGVFNPFFCAAVGDGDVVGMVNVGLAATDASGTVVAGPQYDTYGQSYDIWYTRDLETLTAKSAYEPGDYVVIEVVLKNGAFFSDGTLMTADDVLFNYYVYLDPAYDGPVDLSALPIAGLGDYRMQVRDYEAAVAAAEAALAMGPAYTASSAVTEAQHAYYWAAMNARLRELAQSLVDYVVGADSYIAEYVNPAWTDPAALTDGQKTAAGIAGFDFGRIAGDTLTTRSGKTFTDMNAVTLDDFVFELTAAYVFGNDYAAGYAALERAEAPDMPLLSFVENAFAAHYTQSAAVEGIAGLRKGTKGIVENGQTVLHETFLMILDKKDPGAVFGLCVAVAPKAYYTAAYQYRENALVAYGVEWNSPAFMEHLKTKNGAPLGAGAYRFVSADAEGVTLVRNDYHFTMGDDSVGNAAVKTVCLKIVAADRACDALLGGEVDCADLSACAAIPDDAAYTTVTVEMRGYAYICLNPAAAHLDNLHTRIALASVFDVPDALYRSALPGSWAYPENAQAVYPFDRTLTTAVHELKLAGYTFDEQTGRFTDVPAFTFTLPAEDHAARTVFLLAKELLATIGAEVEIVVDRNLADNAAKGAVAVYALDRQIGADLDLYEDFHYLSPLRKRQDQRRQILAGKRR